MGIGSWFKKWRQQSDAEAIQRQEEWAGETPEERRIAHEGVVGKQDDDFAARNVLEGNIEDAENLALDDDGPPSA
jgi:hypothetical protein